MQKNRYLAEGVRERETHDALCVLKNIYLKMNGRFVTVCLLCTNTMSDVKVKDTEKRVIRV